MAVDLGSLVRDIPDFPKPGIVFKDITPVLASAEALDAAVDAAGRAGARRWSVDVVVGAEARGFLLGAALARELGAGFVLARKPGKLPHETVRAEYLLEYGTDALELHTDAVAAGRARARPRRPAGDRRHGARAVRARRAARRHGRRLRVPDRAGLPRRPRSGWRGYDVRVDPALRRRVRRARRAA